MNRLMLAASLAALLSGGCTVGVAVKPDPATGYLTSGKAPVKAPAIVSKRIDMAEFRPLAVVTAGDFAEDQIRNLGFFGEVIDIGELQKRIVTNNLQDKVPSVSDRIGISNAARNYRPFLWIRSDREKRGKKLYSRLIATDPRTLDDLFITEHELDYVWKGVNDQNTYYPMFNSLIEWLKQNQGGQ